MILMILMAVAVMMMCIFIYILMTKWILYHHLVRLYDTRLGHAPDEITLDRWMNNWRGDGVFMDYVEDIRESRRSSENERIIFTGLCQDDGDASIEHWVPIVEYIGSCFHDYRILIVENDSRDETRALWLEESRRNPKILVMCDDDMPLNTETCSLGIRSSLDKENHLEERVDRMAILRDLYLRRIVRKWPQYDYMAVIDWDLIGHLEVDGFFHALSWIRDGRADVVAVNSFARDKSRQWQVFDTFPLLNNYRCNELHKQKTSMDKETGSIWRERLLRTLNEPMQVQSAFGGMAVYSIRAIVESGSNYMIPREQRTCDIQCEHTSFHRFMRVFIDPWFVLLLKKNMH